MPNRIKEYRTQFVERTPETLENGILYVMPHLGLAIHKCMCSCGETVVTPLLPEMVNGWQWFYDEDGVTLTPSVGNFQYKCKSHYFLTHGRVEWC